MTGHAPKPAPAGAPFVGLIRGINVGGRSLPMAGLRALCAELGWHDVRTYIQSGNLVFRATGPAAALGDVLERAIEERFGLTVPVMVRSAADWASIAEGNPFPTESQREPNLVMLGVCSKPPRPGAVDALRERALKGERIEAIGDVLWIHYASGAGRSMIAPGTLDRFVGSPVTTRNWRTVLELLELARATAD